MRPILLLAIFILVGNIKSKAQAVDSSNKLEFVLQGVEKAMSTNIKLNYRAEMLFKSFGEDSFDIRKFLIAYKVNPNNKLYGYDFEISEMRNVKGILTLLVLDSMMYVIVENKKEILSKYLPKQIEMGSYLETLRQYFIFTEYLFPFINSSPNDIAFKDSTDAYILEINTSGVSTRRVYLNKNTFLPQQYVSKINNYELGLTQTQIVNFSFDSLYNDVPLNKLSPNYYLTSGYNYIEAEQDTSVEETEPKTISRQNLDMLLNYPFQYLGTDTIKLKDFKEKYILLDFWFASCLPCLTALPELNELSSQYYNSDLKVVGINCFDMNNSKALSAKLRSRNITIPILYGKQDILNALDLKNFPSYYLLSKEGTGQFIYGDIRDVKKTINEVMGSK